MTFETKSCYCSVARQSLPCYTAVVRLGFKRRATAVPNSIHKTIKYTLQYIQKFAKLFFIFLFCFRQQPFYSTKLNSTSETKSCYCRAAVELQSSQLSKAVAQRLKQAKVLICESIGFVRIFWKEQHLRGLLAKTNISGKIFSEISVQLAVMAPYKSFYI